MKQLKKCFSIFFLAGFLMAAAPSVSAYAAEGAEEGEAYGIPQLRDLVQTAIMMDALDIFDLKVVDEYAKLFYCELYQQKFKNDFEWNNIRQDITARITGKKEYYRILYQYVVPVYLGRYNFDTQDFPFKRQTAMIGIGAMELLSSSATKQAQQNIACFPQGKVQKSFPQNYMVKLSEALTLDRLKIPVATSEKFLAKMQAVNNIDRLVYLRFRVKLSAARKIKSSGKEVGAGFSGTGYFLGNITSIDVFLDEGLTQFVVNVPLNKE